MRKRKHREVKELAQDQMAKKWQGWNLRKRGNLGPESVLPATTPFCKTCARGFTQHTPGEGVLAEGWRAFKWKSHLTPTAFWSPNTVLCSALHRLVQLSEEDLARDAARPVFSLLSRFSTRNKAMSKCDNTRTLASFTHGELEHETLSIPSSSSSFLDH